MKLKIAEGSDPNYLATVVLCPELKPHPNADRLQIATVFGNDVIVAKDQYVVGEKLVYFPIESSISQKFLSWANLLEKPELNADGKTKGFFARKHGRVKAIKLREVTSQGFLYKVSKLAEYYNVKEDIFKVGESFDCVGDDVLLTKYVRKETKQHEQVVKKPRIPKWIDATIRVLPRPLRVAVYKPINSWYANKSAGIKSLIVEGQWKFHYKTEQLGRNITVVNPEDEIVITDKMHGTSFCGGWIECKKPFSLFRWIGNKFGQDIPETEHKFVYSSRSVLKNRRDGKYTDDVWGKVAKRIEHIELWNYIIYGEICGYTDTGKTIQKNYDYGVPKDDYELFVYRMTENLPDGSVRELSWDEIVTLCDYFEVKTVPMYYKGLAKNHFPIDVNEQWHDKFLARMKEEYLDKTCKICTTGVVNEGVVLRVESKPSKVALKFNLHYSH